MNEHLRPSNSPGEYSAAVVTTALTVLAEANLWHPTAALQGALVALTVALVKAVIAWGDRGRV
jgi:uncharacterized membrane protein YkgB